MSPRSSGRVAVCSPAQARSRRQDAEELLAAAEATTGATPESRKASTAISVLIGVTTAQQVLRSTATLVQAARART